MLLDLNSRVRYLIGVGWVQERNFRIRKNFKPYFNAFWINRSIHGFLNDFLERQSGCINFLASQGHGLHQIDTRNNCLIQNFATTTIISKSLWFTVNKKLILTPKKKLLCFLNYHSSSHNKILPGRPWLALRIVSSDIIREVHAECVQLVNLILVHLGSHEKQ